MNARSDTRPSIVDLTARAVRRMLTGGILLAATTLFPLAEAFSAEDKPGTHIHPIATIESGRVVSIDRNTLSGETKLVMEVPKTGKTGQSHCRENTGTLLKVMIPEPARHREPSAFVIVGHRDNPVPDPYRTGDCLTVRIMGPAPASLTRQSDQPEQEDRITIASGGSGLSRLSPERYGALPWLRALVIKRWALLPTLEARRCLPC